MMILALEVDIATIFRNAETNLLDDDKPLLTRHVYLLGMYIY